jgi:hypothetical protein
MYLFHHAARTEPRAGAMYEIGDMSVAGEIKSVPLSSPAGRLYRHAEFPRNVAADRRPRRYSRASSIGRFSA